MTKNKILAAVYLVLASAGLAILLGTLVFAPMVAFVLLFLVVIGVGLYHIWAELVKYLDEQDKVGTK